jgi:hypothetical protein
MKYVILLIFVMADPTDHLTSDHKPIAVYEFETEQHCHAARDLINGMEERLVDGGYLVAPNCYAKQATDYGRNKAQIKAMSNSHSQFYWQRMNERELTRQQLRVDGWQLQYKRARAAAAKKKLEEAKARLDEFFTPDEQNEEMMMDWK